MLIRVIAALMDPFPHRHVRMASAAFLTCAVMSLTLALIYGWIRADLGGPQILVMLTASMITLSVMAIWITGVVLLREGALSALAIVALITVAVAALLPAIALVPYGKLAFFVFATAVLVVAAYPVWMSWRQLGPMRASALVVLGVIAAASLFLTQNSYTYSHVLGPEMALTGQQHADPLFHAAHAEMLLQFGRMSTGLDGLVSTPYHVLSHLWIGATGRLLGVSTLEAYMLVPPMIGLPLFFFGLAVAVSQTMPGGEENASDWMAVPTALAVLYLVELRDYGAYVASESYLLSMIGALLGIAALVDMTRGRDPALTTRQAFRRDVALGLLALLLMAAKLSVGMVFACAAFWAVFRWRQAKLLHAVAWGIILAIPTLLFVWSTSSSAHSGYMSIDPLHVFRAYPEIAWINFSVCALGLALASGFWFFSQRADRIRLETLGVLVIAAMVPTAALKIGGGSGYYFIHVGTVAVMVFFARLVAGAIRNLGRFSPVAAVALIALVPAAHAATERKRNAHHVIIARANQLVKTLAGPDVTPPARATPASWWRQPIEPLRDFDVAAAKSTSFGQRLIAARALAPAAAMRSTLMHVTPEAERFWRGPQICRNAPLHVPAIAGMAMLKGLPPIAMACDFAGLYGYVDYSAANSHAIAASDAELCQLARAANFGAVITIDKTLNGRFAACLTERR